MLKINFLWKEECQASFDELKAYLANPPLFSKPQPNETLFVYLALSLVAVSAVLISEEDKVQKPIYYASKVLHGAEERYTQIEKMTYALLIASRKLRPYFQAHCLYQ